MKLVKTDLKEFSPSLLNSFGYCLRRFTIDSGYIHVPKHNDDNMASWRTSTYMITQNSQNQNDPRLQYIKSSTSLYSQQPRNENLKHNNEQASYQQTFQEGVRLSSEKSPST